MSEDKSNLQDDQAPEKLPLLIQVLGWIGAWALVSLAGLTTWLLGHYILSVLSWPTTRGPVPSGIFFGIYATLMAPLYGWLHSEKTWTRHSAPGWILLWMLAGLIGGSILGATVGFLEIWFRPTI